MPEKWRDNKTGEVVEVDRHIVYVEIHWPESVVGRPKEMMNAAFKDRFTRIEEPVYVSGGCPADTPKGVTTTAPAEPQGSEGLKLCPPAKAYIVPADSTQIVLELNARIAELERERDQYKFDAGMSEARMHELEQQLSEETEAGKVRVSTAVACKGSVWNFG
jgi:hypothetical protein